jgi:hypothetical protein
MGSTNIIKINSLAWSVGNSRVQTFSLIEIALQSAHKYVCYGLGIGTIPIVGNAHVGHPQSTTGQARILRLSALELGAQPLGEGIVLQPVVSVGHPQHQLSVL